MSRSRAPRASSDVLAQIDARVAVRHHGVDHRLVVGDCVAVLDALPAESVDLMFADPPDFLSNGGTTCSAGQRVAVDKGRWDSSRGLATDHAWNLRWLGAAQRALKPSGTLWVSGTQHVIFSIGFAMQSLGYHLLNTITWFKPNASPNLACRFFTHSTEILLWASPQRQAAAYVPLPRDEGRQRRPSDARFVAQMPAADGEQVVWTLPTPGKRRAPPGRHPTQKPRALLDRIVRAGSSPGELVLDPFNGSGTTGVSALAAGRRYVGIDIDANYLDLTARRMAELG